MANNMRLLGIFALAVAVSGWPSLGHPALAAEKNIAAGEAYELSVKNRLTVIDIRSPKEWVESGIPKSARAITMHDPRGNRAFLEAIKAAVSGHMDQPIAVICAVGGRSRWAQRYLSDNGFSNVVDITEGMFGRGKGKPGWVKRNLPVETCRFTENNTAVRCGAP